MEHDWNTEYPEPGTKVVRLPNHDEDEEYKMFTGHIYTVKKCSAGSIYFEENNGSWEPKYFAPAPVETPKSETYEIY